MIKFLEGDKELFNSLKKGFETGLTKAIDAPGHNSLTYLLSTATDSYFIKSNDNWKKEIIAYNLAKKMGLESFFLNTAAFELVKDEKSTYFSVNNMLKEDFIAIQDLEYEKQGSMDGILQKYIDSGEAHKLAIFDYIIGNKDRHRGNVLTNGSQIVLIDHDQAFSDKNYHIPAYLRKSDWKDGADLPLCKNIVELEDWFNKLSFKSEFLQKRYDEIKNFPGIRLDEKINYLWRSA